MGQIKYASFSERGVRSNNEDYIQSITDPVDDRYLFVVCDGMGGHDKGEVACQVVGSTICECWGNVSSDNDIVYVLREAFKQASEALDVKADMLNHVEMGTTMVLAAIDGNKLTIAHAGDSRAYFLRHNDGMVYQTKDHLAHSVWGILLTVVSSLISVKRLMWKYTSLSYRLVIGYSSAQMECQL